MQINKCSSATKHLEVSWSESRVADNSTIVIKFEFWDGHKKILDNIP